MHVYCPKCEAANSADAVVCYLCGHRLSAPDKTTDQVSRTAHEGPKKKRSWWLTPMVGSWPEKPKEAPLKKCPACSHEIHATAEKCPGCGKQLRKSSIETFFLFLGIALLVLLMLRGCA